ncbi:hypothetical protein ACFSTC_43800 [Nonomuraea ferruginea]
MPDRVTALAPDAGLSEADRYDVAAGHHEHVLEKYCRLLGTSFAGVVAGEDLAAAAYLRGRPDIGPVGCAGLSGGGLRAALLGAFDPGVRAVVVAAMTSSYADLLDGYVAAHTWMLFPRPVAGLRLARAGRVRSAATAAGAVRARRPAVPRAGDAHRPRGHRPPLPRRRLRGQVLRRPARLRCPDAGARLHLAG